MPESFKVNSDKTNANCIEWVKSLREKHKYFRLTLTTGDTRGLEQNSLLHVWLSEWIEQASGIKPAKKHIEQLKRSLKEQAYLEGLHYTLETYQCRITKKEKKRWVSTKEYTVGELTYFLDFIQCLAAKQDVILVAKGDYKRNKEKQNA
jgi:hypothetical protein